jgi:integrase/recombinase XerD
MKKKEPKSIYAPYIKEFIDMKRSLGFKYVNEETSFMAFDKYLKHQANNSIEITKDLTDQWLDKHPNDSAIQKYKRLAFIKSFSEYLIIQGFKSYIPQLPKYPDKTFIPYIYSYEDICAVFNACDELRLSRRKTNTALLIMPCLLRMLYGTGIRISEALSLQNKDINIDEKYLVIRESKNGKQRLVPFTNSLADVCTEYLRHRNQIPTAGINDQDQCFFVSPIGLPCKVNAIHVWFYQILIRAGITNGGCNQRPRIHDLRHSFACHEGLDLYCSWPYLSAYLGHQSLRMTEQYIRLSSQMYPELLKGTEGLYVNIISENYKKREL